MQTVRLVFMGIVGGLLIIISLANRSPVTLRLLPEEISGYFPGLVQVTVPVFLVFFGGIFIGLLIGFVWEWMREYKQRVEAARSKREIASLRDEVDGLKKRQSDDKDDILALIE